MVKSVRLLNSQVINYWCFCLVDQARQPKASVFDDLGLGLNNQLSHTLHVNTLTGQVTRQCTWQHLNFTLKSLNFVLFTHLKRWWREIVETSPVCSESCLLTCLTSLKVIQLLPGWSSVATTFWVFYTQYRVKRQHGWWVGVQSAGKWHPKPIIFNNYARLLLFTSFHNTFCPDIKQIL